MSFGYVPDYKGKFFLKDLYLRIFGYPYAPRRNEARLVFRLLKPKKGERILDLGCGDGIWYNDLRKRGIDVIGVDVSERDLKKAKERAKKMNGRHQFVLCEGQKMVFKENSFDKIFSISVLEHIPDDTAVFREGYRILKPNGIMVVSIPKGEISSVVKLALRMPEFIKKHFFSVVVRRARDEKEYRENFDEKFRHFRTYNTEELLVKVKSEGFITECIDYNARFFSSFFTGLIHAIKIFEWDKTPESDYQFKSQLIYGILFPIVYPLFRFDDLLLWKKGRGIVLKIRKNGDRIV